MLSLVLQIFPGLVQENFPPGVQGDQNIFISLKPAHFGTVISNKSAPRNGIGFYRPVRESVRLDNASLTLRKVWTFYRGSCATWIRRYVDWLSCWQCWQHITCGILEPVLRPLCAMHNINCHRQSCLLIVSTFHLSEPVSLMRPHSSVTLLTWLFLFLHCHWWGY